MKEVDIYVLGKYEYNTGVGTWIFYMTHRGAVLKRMGYIDNAGSSVRTTLYALMQALDRIKEPCDLRIHSRANLGFLNMQKSRNKDLLMHIQRAIVNSGHTFSHDTKFDNNLIEKWETDNKNKINKAKKEAQQEAARREQEEADRLIQEQAMKSADWREMYWDLMGPSQGCWVPGQGGY